MVLVTRISKAITRKMHYDDLSENQDKFNSFVIRIEAMRTEKSKVRVK